MAKDMQRSFRLFVTHVDGDGPFLKICGQLEKQSACMVESLIESSRENFEKGIGAVPAAAIREGIVCAAKYKDGTYYRAKIISVAGLASGLVGVHFIDYGNKDVISLSTIRFLDNYDPILLQLPGQGTDYYLSRIMHPSGRWEEQLLLKLQSLLCYSEYPATIEAQTHTVPIIAVLFQGNDLSQHLVANKYGIALPVTKQEVLLLQLMNESVQSVSSSWPQSFSPDVNSYADHVPFLVNQNFPSNPALAMRLQQNVSIGYNSGYAAPPSAVSQRLLMTKASRTPVNLRAPMRQPGTQSPIPVTTPPAHMQAPTTPPSKLGSPKRATKTYKSKLLEANSQHKAFVSYAEEGPELFAVQLVTEGNKLETMMDEINRQPHRSLAEPPMIGTVCLGRMSGDRIICRAIVMNLSGQQCKLFFVDFGDTEMVSYYDIFDIPEEFVKPNVFAMRFCLSGVKNLQKGPHLNEAFKQLVNGKVVTLRVVPPEGPPLIQYGELFLENKNVLDILMTTIKETLQFRWIEPLVRGSKHSVLVSYVDSCVKFFVQRSDQIDELNAVMEAVKNHCERSASPGQLPVGAACCARFADDDNWYRARVREVRENKSVVAYVDYGNEQEVVAADLRTITPDLIQLPAQALKCSLKGFEDKPVETKTSNQLEMLALEKTLMAHIMGVVSEDTMLVSLVDDTVTPPLDVARKMLQLSQPRSNHESKATTPVRKDAPEAFSSPEGSQADDKRKPFRRETSFREERRNTSRESDDFAQRGGSFRGRENRDGFDRSGLGRHSEKFGGRPDKGDRRGGKPWENKSPISAADDQWEESPPAAQRPSRDNRDKDNKFNKQDEWEEKKTDTWDANRPRTERRDFGDRQDRPERRGFGDREDRPERRGFGDRDNRPERREYGDRDNRPERRDFGDRDNRPERRNFGDRDNRPERRDFGDRDNRPERRDFGDRDNRPERKDFGDRNGDRKNNWEDKKENNFQKRDFRGGDRPPRSNFNPRDRADRSFGSDGNKSDNSTRPYKPRGKFSEVQHKDLPNPVALDTPFTEPSIEPNAQHEVSVTWIISPGSFYTQILSLQPKFLEMMHRIPEIYKGVKPYAGSITEGASVLARYPEDKVLYRATVITSQPFGKYIVQYIDFGNKFLVDSRDIWQLDQELMELPKMAVHCSLLGVAPTEGEWKANSEVDLCFNGPRYQCVFQDCVEGKHNVSLWSNGVSVADTLVEKQLAVGADSAAVTLKDDPIDLTIVLGQELPCRVTHVQSFEEFYIQLDFQKADLVESVIANYDASLLEPLNKESLADGVHCTVKHEGKVFRTILTDTSDSAAIKAVLPDYGNTITTTLDNLMILPTDLSVYYYQSLQCCFNNYTAESTQLMTLDELKQLLGKHFIVYVNDVAGNTLVTTLYEHATGTKLALFTPDEGAFPSVAPLSAHSVLHRGLGGCHVTHAAALEELWLQRASDAERLATLLDELYKHYEEGTPEPLESFEADGLCAAKSSDGNWYRATILSSTETDCTVQFPDYGNSETVPKETVKRLDTRFYEPCALAVQVSLGLVALADDALTKLQEWIGENEVQVTLSYGTDGWLANLHLDGVDLSIKLVNEKLATPQVDGQETEAAEASAAEPKAPEGCTQVYISHIDTPGLFWLQMSDKIDAIEEIQEQLQANAAAYEDVESRELGTVCVAKYLADELWYRAEILDADADITTVRFIDYGNTDVLDNQPGLLKLIPDALKEIERYAVKASVNAVPTGTGQWSEPASECFTRLVGDLSVPVDALIVLKDHHHDTTYLDVFIDGQNLTDKLVADGHATRSDETECGGDLPSCYASHVNSPSEFWIQLESATPELQAMESAMVDAETFPELTDKEEGVICAAKYPEDDSWYRAQVIVDGSEGTEVLFMDYGNASIATELRNLPEELKAKPALSRKCALQKPRDLSWSRKSESKFNELAAEGATVFNVQFIASGDISIVELFYEGKSVTEELVGMCEQAPSTEAAPQETEATVTETVTKETETTVTQAVTEEAAAVPIPERPTPLGQEQSNGKIGYANSIEEFYVQLDTASADLGKVMERLIDGPEFEALSEVQVGSSCAAFWAEDEQWYRAKVLELGDGGNQVQFTDYGNKAKCTDFRQLPEDLAAIEPIAKCCRLTTDATSSNEKMKKRFDDLIAADWTFQIEFVDTTKEPFLVKLLLNGEDIFAGITTEGTPEPETKADKLETEETINIPAIETAQTEADNQETISAPAIESAQTEADNQATISAPAIESAQTEADNQATISAPAIESAQTEADNQETISAPAIESTQTEADNQETISAPAIETAQTEADEGEPEETVTDSAIESAQTEADNQETISAPDIESAQTEADNQETISAPAIETAQTEADEGEPEETVTDSAIESSQTEADKQETVNASESENTPNEVVTKLEENEVVQAEDEKVDAPETPAEATEVKTTELDSSLNESIESNHTVIENKSFEADAETLDKEISEITDDGFKSEAQLSPENNSSVDTLESSNETIKTPEKETNETIKTPERDTDTGYTSGGDHDKSPVTEPLEKENPEKPKSQENTAQPILPAAKKEMKPVDPAKFHKSF